MDPTQPTPSAPATASPPAGEPLVKYICTQRASAAGVLGVLSVLFLGVGVFLALRSFRPADAPTPDKPLTEEKFNPEKPFEPTKAPLEIANLKKVDYTIGWIGCLIAFLVAAIGASWLMARPPELTEASQKTEARLLLLFVGMGWGVLLMFVGLVFFYRWSESLTKWLDTNETSELRWVIVPLMMIVLGAGFVFAAIQPARAEERNNAPVRQIVYGSNFGLTILLLIVALVVFNVVVAVKVPNKLDTTATGFYELSDRTKQLLNELKEPVTAYAVLPNVEGRPYMDDMRQLLMSFQDSGRGRFKVKFLDETANRKELHELRAKYPQMNITLAQRDVAGLVLLTVGEDEKRHAVIPDTEFSTAQGEKPAFQGESRLFRELVILSDTETKPIVYFTQANGEMSIDPAAEVQDDRKLSRLRSYLEKNYIDVRPLNFSLENPVVPADAAVVVIAEPRVPFSPAAAAAIKKYMTDPGKKGRLVVLAGIVSGPNNAGVLKTGLEDVLKDLNVGLGNRFVYTFPQEEREFPLETLAAFTNVAMEARNDIALTVSNAVQTVTLDLPREVEPLQTNPGISAIPLMGSVTATWLEEDRIPDAALRDTYVALVRSPDIRKTKRLTTNNRSLAVVVTDRSNPATPVPLAAVYGSAEFVSDRTVQKRRNAVPLVLVGVSIDWLRGKPSIAASGIEAKKYSEYLFPKPTTLDTARLEYLPLGLAFLSIVGLGTGVWIVRRR